MSRSDSHHHPRFSRTACNQRIAGRHCGTSPTVPPGPGVPRSLCEGREPEDSMGNFGNAWLMTAATRDDTCSPGTPSPVSTLAYN